MKDLRTLKDKLQKPIPLKGIETKIFMSVLFLILVGLGLSILFTNWSHFERIGSLIVIIGIYITWRDLSGNIDLIDKNLNKFIDIELAKIREKKPLGSIGKTIIDSKQVEFDQQTKKIKTMLELLKKRLRKIEGFVLILGTLIWGYGSVIGNLIHTFKD